MPGTVPTSLRQREGRNPCQEAWGRELGTPYGHQVLELKYVNDNNYNVENNNSNNDKNSNSNTNVEGGLQHMNLADVGPFGAPREGRSSTVTLRSALLLTAVAPSQNDSRHHWMTSLVHEPVLRVIVCI